MKYGILFFLLVIFQSQCLAQSMRTIVLEHRTASQIEDKVKSILQKNETVVSHGNKMIVFGEPDRVEILDKLIKTLDTPVANVQVLFSMGHDRPSSQLREYENRIKDFNHVDRHYKRKQIANTHEDRQNIQMITLLDGGYAEIQSEYAFALLDYQAGASSQSQATLDAIKSKLKQVMTDNNSASTIIEQTTENANTQFQGNHSGSFFENQKHYDKYQEGLYISVELINNKALLSLAAKEGTLKPYANTEHEINHSQHQMLTQVLVPLNQWIYLGGNRSLEDTITQGYHFKTQAKSEAKHHIWIKVQASEIP